MKITLMTKWLLVAFMTVRLAGLSSVLRAAEPQPAPAPTPVAADWIDIRPHIAAAGGWHLGPCVSVDRINGNVYALPQSDKLWISTDRGQTFQWLYPEVKDWGFTMTPTCIHVSPNGTKISIFSSSHSGYSADGGKTWKVFNFKLPYGLNSGLVNSDEDAKIVLAHSYTHPARVWISRDGGDTLTDITTPENNTLNLGLLEGGVIVTPAVRSEDFGKTWTKVENLPSNKQKAIQFIGVADRFKGKTYWLTNVGVFTTPDVGKTWTPVGNYFPSELATGSSQILTGPVFGKNESHMLVLTTDRIIETLDGGKEWHTLAYTPEKWFGGNPYNYFFSYDPISDILYASHQGHGGPPFIFARLALKRWGNIDSTAPSKPGNLVSKIINLGNDVLLSWTASTGKNSIAWYRIYQNQALKCYAHGTEAIITDLNWSTHYNFEVRAVDEWQNISEPATRSVDIAAASDNVIALTDLEWVSAVVPNDVKGTIKKDHTPAGDALVMVMPGSTYQPTVANLILSRTAEKGLGFPRSGTVTYSLGKKYKRFTCDLNAACTWPKSTGVFTIRTDGVEKYVSPQLSASAPTASIDMNVTGADTLVLDLVGSPLLHQRNERALSLNLGNAFLYKK